MRAFLPSFRTVALCLAFFILLWVAQGVVKGVEGCAHGVPQCPTEMQP